MSIWNEMNPWYRDPILTRTEQRRFAFALLTLAVALVFALVGVVVAVVAAVENFT